MAEKDLTCFSCANVITTSETGKPVACRKGHDELVPHGTSFDCYEREPGADEQVAREEGIYDSAV